jgi:prepilin signal peptidase PulO-like enzyme (type II secretory pathway)
MPGSEVSGSLQIALMVLLGFFVFASFLLAFATLTNAWRLRNVMLTWKEGRLGGYPLFATFFLMFTAFLMLLAIWKNQTYYIPVVAAYMFFGVNWVISSYYMSKRYITDNGLVKNINDPSQTVAWKYIHDFIVHENEKGFKYVFMYAKRGARKDSSTYLRLELEVPNRKSHAFKKIIDHKLGRRFQYDTDSSIIDSQINYRN